MIGTGVVGTEMIETRVIETEVIVTSRMPYTGVSEPSACQGARVDLLVMVRPNFLTVIETGVIETGVIETGVVQTRVMRTEVVSRSLSLSMNS